MFLNTNPGRAAVLFLLIIPTVAMAQTDLDRHVVANGGGTSDSANHRMSFTVGQAAAGFTTDGSQDINVGFWTGNVGAAVSAPGPEIPLIFGLDQNHPNPFNPRTVIRFSLPEAAPVSLAIYNIRGQRVRQLLNENREAGHHDVVWTGSDDLGRSLPSGAYVAQIVSSFGTQNRKMLLAR